MTTATDFAVPTIWFKSRNEAYLEILGPALYSTLNARTRGLIYWYSRRFRAQCGGELALLVMITKGLITISQILDAHQQEKKAG